jgi:hypothetical protein
VGTDEHDASRPAFGRGDKAFERCVVELQIGAPAVAFRPGLPHDAGFLQNGKVVREQI